MNDRPAKNAPAADCQGLLGDRQFHWAVLCALPVWLAGYLWFAPDFRGDWPLRHPRDLLFLGLVYPLVEELLFRGLLQGWLLKHPGLRRRRFGLSGANLIVSTLFSALHLFAHPPLAAAAVMLPSLIFGHFRDRHGSLCAPILLHVYYNVGYFWIFAG